MTWRERWLKFRNDLLADPRFQRWAAAFPLTRPIARRRARGLFDLVAGFVYSQILLAGVRLNVFEILASGPLTISQAANALSLSEAAAERLLKALAALDLAEQLDDRFMLGVHGAALRANPSLIAMIEHHAMLYEDLVDPVALLRGETQDRRLKNFWAYAANPDAHNATPDDVRAYSQLMAQSQAMIAAEVLNAYAFDAHHTLLDVGGGEAAFVIAVGARAAHLQLMVFDLPAVALRAEARLAAAGFSQRSVVHRGSFFSGALPKGADIITLVRVLHDHDDHAARALLRCVHDALPPGGTVLIAEPMSNTPGAAPVGDAYFGFYFAAMGSGRTRSMAEIFDFLRTAKFETPREIPTHTPLVTRVIIANKSAQTISP